jgi:Flp pilus assembly protein TadD/SAM-dependent methyltransferase
MNRRERRAAKKDAKSGAESGAGPIGAKFRLAVQHHKAGRLATAEQHYREILTIVPNHGGSLQYLAIIVHERGDSESALGLLGKAIAAKPGNPECHYNIALIFAACGRTDEAVTHYRRAIALKTDYPEAHNNLAGMLLTQGRGDEAILHYWHALTYAPQSAQAHVNLARALLIVGNPERALSVVMKGLATRQHEALKRLFVTCIINLKQIPTSDKFRSLLLRAFTELWGRPADMASAGTSVVLQGKAAGGDLAEMSRDRLLRCLLESAPLHDLVLEQLLTNARLALLDLAAGQQAPGDEILEFCCAVAQQCFLNEYVFAFAEAERARVAVLRDDLAAALSTGASFSALSLAVVASYFPLNSIPGARALLGRVWPDAVIRLLLQQVTEPDDVERLLPTIPVLTAIDDAVSLSVKAQYEENPYPRWSRAAAMHESTTFDEELRKLFPHVSYRPLGKRKVDVLVAGCGTGQHSIKAGEHSGSNVLAIDISLSSLGYAKSKTESLGMHNIEYGQADILKLAGIDRSFDVIESIGVLHHLGNPFKGWRVLLSLLRPGGFMRIGLYSAKARRDVTDARAFIAERGYGSMPEDIRRCRQAIIARAAGDLARGVTERWDFYSTSGCRDLLFHVQEHQFELAEIKSFLKDEQLVFIGFENIPGPMIKEYLRWFPEDAAMTDLDNWDALEKQHPTVFGSMYRFWIQK